MIKMKNKFFYLYITTALTMIIPTNGRFAYGLTLVFELFFLVLFTNLLQSLIKKIKFTEFIKPFTFFFVFVLTVLYEQLIGLFSPFIALTLGFNFYLTALATIPTIFFTSDYIIDLSLGNRLKKTLKQVLLYSLFALFFFLLRDIISFGTVTLPTSYSLLEIKIIKPLFDNNSFFWNSIPFALILLSVIYAIACYINRKFEVVRRFN